MNNINYILNKDINSISFGAENSDITLSQDMIMSAIHKTNSTIDKVGGVEGVDIFEILGMRNLSAFMGELFVSCIVNSSEGLLRKNPHQDGYPDLLAMTKDGILLWEKLSQNLKDKSPFSPFETGGLEVKATCGAVPTPAALAKKGLEKPYIGDSRINFLRGYDWKSHHRETNNLLGLLWDFVDGKPRIVSLFYSDDLTEDDWGKIVQPKTGGGRTTSVSIMNRVGIKKMYDRWLFVIDDIRYIEFLNKYNKDTLISKS